MTCPACGCKETYQYDDWNEFSTSNEDTQRCAACGAIFDLEDELDEEEEDDPQPEGYWCVVCGRFLPVDGGVIVHDKIPHPESMNFSEDDRPQ